MLQDFYDAHKHSPSAEAYFSKLHKGASSMTVKVLALEILINTLAVCNKDIDSLM
jgi:hypothetical protein